MPVTRRSARVAAQSNSSPAQDNSPSAGTKRKTDATGSSPSAKRGKKDVEKYQKTIEETMKHEDPAPPNPDAKEDARAATTDENATKDVEMTDVDGGDKAAETKEPVSDSKTPAAQTNKEPEGTSDNKPASPPSHLPQESGAEKSEAHKATVVDAPSEKKPEETTAPAADTHKRDEHSAPKSEQASTQQPAPAEQSATNAQQPSAQKPADSSTRPMESHSKPAEAVQKPTESAQSTVAERPAQTQAEPKSHSTSDVGASKPAQPAEKKDETTARGPEPSINGTSSVTQHQQKQESAASSNGTAVEPKAREDDVPSSIMEKGIVYFFYRARVNVSDPQDTTDIARTYLILRPIPHGAKLGEGPIGDDGNCRLIALPKKVLPLSGKDRFMVFVEKAKLSFRELKESFLSGSDYETKTAGTSHSPAATPVAEGVYAITTTGRESHLAYMTTIPGQLGEVQKDIGLRDSGSFVVSAKNPKYPGPANASLGKDPGYPQHIADEFRDLRWMPLQPKLLDYVNTQFLLIGQSGGIENATEQLPRDEKKDKDTPLEEIQKLEGEDEIRVKHLKGDDAVFAELGVSKRDYPKVPTTW